jgi:hypothetical protein
MQISLAELAVGQATVAGTQTSGAVVSPAQLPDAPDAVPDRAASSSIFGVTQRTNTGNLANKFHLVIHSGQYGMPLNGGDKLELSVRSRLTVTDLVSTAFAVGWSQMRDSAPHFGTDSGAFGERLGALAVKQTTQSIFSYGMYANLFHDDPRYYVMGSRKKVGIRALYSASRLVIAQTDSGRASFNWPKFAGIASATALTNVYYPSTDHGFEKSVSAFGVSLGTSILTNEIHEFLGDGLRQLRHKQN